VGLYNKTVKGVTWSLLSTILNILIQVCAGIVLARLLTPADFGVYAMCFAILVISRGVIDSGFYQALIQKKDADQIDFSLVFHVNLFLSLILFFLLFFNSDKVERFYGQEGISEIIKFLSFLLLIEAFSLIQKASLIKEIKFDQIAKIETSSKLISLSFSVLLAYGGYGVWSLLLKDLLFSIMTTFSYWYLNPIKILLYVPYNRLKSLFNFGFKVFIADQIESLSNQIAQIIVGKKFSAADLGFFNKSEEFQKLFAQTPIVSINKVMFPSFVQIQNDNYKLKQKYKTLIEVSLFFIFPILFNAILIANEMVVVLIGDKWIESVLYFQILCVSGMFYPFTVYNLNLLKVKGLAGLYLKTCLLSKGLLLPIIFISIKFGVIGLVLGLVFQRFFAVLVNSYNSGKIIDFSIYQQVKSVSKSFFISAQIFIFLFYIKCSFTDGLSDIFNLLFLSVTYLFLYMILSLKFQKNKIETVIKLISFFRK